MIRNKQLLVNFSGGKDSTALLLMLLEKGYQVDKVVRVDFGTEYPEMYKHIQDVENYVKEKYPFVEFVTIDLKEKWIYGLKKKGYPHFGLRWCTGYKVHAIEHIIDVECYHAIGIAYDELHRMNKAHKKNRTNVYPLVEWGITEKDCLDYCKSKGFSFYGLYEERKRVSCFCCPFSKNIDVILMPNELIERIRYYESISNPMYNSRCYDKESFDERRKRLESKLKR